MEKIYNWMETEINGPMYMLINTTTLKGGEGK